MSMFITLGRHLSFYGKFQRLDMATGYDTAYRLIFTCVTSMENARSSIFPRAVFDEEEIGLLLHSRLIEEEDDLNLNGANLCEVLHEHC